MPETDASKEEQTAPTVSQGTGNSGCEFSLALSCILIANCQSLGVTPYAGTVQVATFSRTAGSFNQDKGPSDRCSQAKMFTSAGGR